jgi:hypothetical protein
METPTLTPTLAPTKTRRACRERNTLETRIRVEIDLDGSGRASLGTGSLFWTICSTRWPAMG